MPKPYAITTTGLSLAEFDAILRERKPITLAKDAVSAVKRSHAWLLQTLKESDTPIYGVNTGFGALHDRSIAKRDLAQLQKNLVMSHACGSGEPVPAEIVRAMLVLKVQNMAFGHSAVALSTVQRLIDMYNADVLPVVYERGSLGASGDLAPLAHLALPLLGLGEVVMGGRRMTSAAALKKLGWAPLELGPKEGLALLNGTQFMNAYAALLTVKSMRLAHIADMIAAVSLDAFDGRTEPFHPRVHAVRPHPGQAQVAGHMRELLAGSAIALREKQHVQDPYSFRCIPQVHGASRDAIAYVERVVERELSVQDFVEEALEFQAQGAHFIGLVTPSPQVPQIREALVAAKKAGLALPVIYNSSGYDSVEQLKTLEGLVDIYLPDLKYADDTAARKYSQTPGYVAASREAVLEMHRQTGDIRINPDTGLAVRGLWVRHLVLPLGLAGTWETLCFLALEVSAGVGLSLMSQYTPLHRAWDFPELSRPLLPSEYRQALDMARDLGFQNVLSQDLETAPENAVPDFSDQQTPFRRF